MKNGSIHDDHSNNNCNRNRQLRPAVVPPPLPGQVVDVVRVVWAAGQSSYLVVLQVGRTAQQVAKFGLQQSHPAPVPGRQMRQGGFFLEMAGRGRGLP